ncbi:DUF2971 domain-containing protein [Sphingobium yanoikuyae]|uniref:DUF2971 domain-containing protein n=1 Tax=Sphingobium yanoikuyae TaxID=13690 RepID=UPI0031DA85DF
MAIDATTRKVLELIFCYDRKRVNMVKAKRRLIAHYTTAETAMKILSGRSLWLRNAGVMNDYSEVDYGRNIVYNVLRGPLLPRFKAALDGIGDGLHENVVRGYAESLNHAREIFFLSSLSEHCVPEQYGRLSMWRAYGGPVAGVALLFKGDVIDLELDMDMALSATPVLYGDETKFTREFEILVHNLETSMDFLKSVDVDIVSNAMIALLQTSMLGIKHAGFAEEREWRIIHRPIHFPSDHVKARRCTLGGTPQTIYEVPFHNPDGGFDCLQLDLNELLFGIMIGPCAYPETVFRAVRDEMEAAGIVDADKRIFNSGIPLRQQW